MTGTDGDVISMMQFPAPLLYPMGYQKSMGKNSRKKGMKLNQIVQKCRKVKKNRTMQVTLCRMDRAPPGTLEPMLFNA